ncbi:HlyD family type I secretion periplasmic adaptor subunit [Alsobacter soli]|uniref:Membrane fusion protein (MFP) family protein n=1 Tax=Alsobacter soli TaxID=2109933 RepID=A0A2T1HV55_9HYPH|nr:HlyD family type I secretion periplasmic adaptor subunit [Alsobacter soli]PSC05536.1 HlyD family type I secretion periplasmic adaptor subunit [Alsobacter soli]
MADFEFAADLVENTSAMRRLMRSFFLSSTLILAGVGGWAAWAKVDSAVLAQGSFVVQSSAQAVQHLEGGVIGAILVKDGQRVEEGQVLVKLDAAKVIADLAIRDRKLIELTAQKARLEAEQADRAVMATPPPPLPTREARSAYAEAIAAQQRLLTERLSTRASQLSQQQERKRQVEAQIAGLNDRITAIKEEMKQATGELTDLRMLDAKGLVRRPVLRQSEREVSRLRGELGDTESRVAGARSQLSEAEFKIAEIVRTARSEALTQLQSISAQLAEVQEDRLASLDRMQRLEIRAPRTGLVHELAVHTVGGIVAPGQKLMSIIPTTDPLLVNARIPPDEIDQVRVGQDAVVRISAFKLPVTPELNGHVTGVSADQVVDDHTGQPYFSVKIAIAPGERSKLQGKDLVPGLPAEVMILGEPRRVITYLVQPITDKLNLALREK